MTRFGSSCAARLRGTVSRISWAAAGIASTICWLVAPSAAAQPQFTSLHSFSGADGFGPMAGVVKGADGALYGTTSGQANSPIVGTVFRFDRAMSELTTIHGFVDGARPFAGLVVDAEGTLYGTTYSGGAADVGTLFRVGPDGQGFASLHSFSGIDGANPDDLKLIHTPDGMLYGATSEGGPDGGGTLFQFDLATQMLTTRYSFLPAGTGGLDAGLVMGTDGNWYGTTYAGGANGLGSVFRVDPSTFELTTLHDFMGADGANPVPGALMQGGDGNLYGTTQLGGNGKVYKLNPTTLVYTTLHTFSGITDGRFPLGGVTEGGDGYLYGTTVLGGQGYGTIYRVHPTTLAYNIVVPFSGANGRSPSGNLYRASDGALYGVTRLGGAFNGGTLFRLSVSDTAPPTITSIAAVPNVLWPPNGKMIPVTVIVAVNDAVDPAPQCAIVGVASNQPASGDWTITGDLTLNLRARRSGSGDRIYTMTIECTDAASNSATGSVGVSVPSSAFHRSWDDE